MYARNGTRQKLKLNSIPTTCTHPNTKWTHAHTGALAALLAVAPGNAHRPFTSFWLAALGVAQQYKLVYGHAPYKLSSMLRQIGAAVAVGSTVVFLRYPDVARRLATKHKCSMAQFWASHILYHVCPVIAVAHYGTLRPAPRAFAIAIHLLWAVVTDMQKAYVQVGTRPLWEGMAMAIVAHLVV